MKVAGHRLTMIPPFIGVLIWVVMLSAALVLHHPFDPGPMILLLFVFYPVVLGCVLWLDGWIVEGFAQKEKP